MKKISCQVIRDLLPSYADGIVSEDSVKLIEEHLQECEECKKIADGMCGIDETVPSTQKQEVDYLKKLKKKHRHILLGALIAVVACITAGLSLYSMIYGGGYLSNETKYRLKVDHNKVEVEGNVPEGFIYSQCVAKENNQEVDLRIECRRVLLSGLAKDKRDFNESYTFTKDIRILRINGDVVWEDGVSIEEHVRKEYGEKHDYIGNVSQNEALMYEMGIGNQVGEYTIQLQTKKEPYGLVINRTQSTAVNKEVLNKYSYRLLALIKNLDYVTWNNAQGAGQSYTVSQKDASTKMKRDIKWYGESVKDYQVLMDEM